ncbi:5-formyltetrahydrofolate cyclo-ligase [bacterium]|nr:5-formyltetrahydrofolate cyclo-ligase [bacterium]
MKKDSKASIRRIYSSKRDGLTADERRIKSCLIIERLLSLPEFQEAESCLAYASFRSEVETDSLISTIIEMGKRLALPVTDLKAKRLLLCEIKNGLKSLSPSTYGIREPSLNGNRLIYPNEIDLFIVPGVAFDMNGTRLGYGGGYYDRLLCGVRSKPAFALAYEIQIASALPCEATDIRVKKILTEDRLIDCIKDHLCLDPL